jgi:hypothetical protein
VRRRRRWWARGAGARPPPPTSQLPPGRPRGAPPARAAAITAQVNIEVNLRGLKDPSVLDELAAMAEVTDDVVARADRVVAAVREEISR